MWQWLYIVLKGQGEYRKTVKCVETEPSDLGGLLVNRAKDRESWVLEWC
jgi:hypothetical protein